MDQKSSGFRINRVYTRSGDTGSTGLVGGERVPKTDPRVCSYGDIDELNSHLGFVKERLNEKTQELRDLLEYVQQELFDLGSELATPPSSEYPGMWHVGEKHIELLEKLCDKYGEDLPELSSFILPGGSELAAALHIARTVCRRAERSVVALHESGEAGVSEHRVSTLPIIYLNRLSDLLFILCRWSLRVDGREAPLWSKGDSRKPPL